MSKKIFVVGAPRSGTTYLARAMGLAEDVAYFEESGAFSHYGSRRFVAEYAEVLRKSDAFDYRPVSSRILSVTDRLRGRDRLAQIVHSLLLHTKLQPYDLKPSNPLVEVQQCKLDAAEQELEAELIKKYQKLGAEEANSFFRAFFEDFVQMSGKKHLLEKTPGHLQYSPMLISAFPDANVVLIQRDKKDSIASFLKNFNARNGSFINRVSTDRMLLKKYCKACLYFERIEQWMEQQEWCHVVDYQEMVGAPFETVQSALQWAGLEISEEQCRPLFKPRKASSKWGSLIASEQALVEQLMDAGR
jgi:hypothetical protein